MPYRIIVNVIAVFRMNYHQFINLPEMKIKLFR